MLNWLAGETRDLQRFSVLDVGSGFGDALRQIHRRAVSRGQRVRLVGLDLHPWSTRAARESTPANHPIEFLTEDLFRYVPPEPFDFVISTQFAHHLNDSDITRFIRWMERHARCGWFICDLMRHRFSYLGFPLLAFAAGWHHYVRHDGRVSIGRSFVPGDWRRLLQSAGVPEGAATISRHAPFRLCVSRRCALP
ncbi:MAG: methyltransferase domain-containing protein [Acetobacteraceae bacterium]